MTWRTNNNLKMQFKANGMNQCTNVSRTGIMVVSGAMDQPSGGATISVAGTGLPTTAADVYSDGAWASQNAATLADGQNTYTATITDTCHAACRDEFRAAPPEKWQSAKLQLGKCLRKCDRDL